MIAIGSDHAGLPLKEEIIKHFREKGIEFKDYGTYTTESVDYSDYGRLHFPYKVENVKRV